MKLRNLRGPKPIRTSFAAQEKRLLALRLLRRWAMTREGSANRFVETPARQSAATCRGGPLRGGTPVARACDTGTFIATPSESAVSLDVQSLRMPPKNAQWMKRLCHGPSASGAPGAPLHPEEVLEREPFHPPPGGMGVSGGYMNHFTQDRTWHHIVDPRTGHSPTHFGRVGGLREWGGESSYV
jgi:hypothetical protein